MARKPKSPFAVERGKKIKMFRVDQLKVSQARLAESLGVADRETISQYESGIIGDIALPAVKELIRLGMRAEDLVEDVSTLEMVQRPIEASAEARRIAYAWDEMPELMREYMMQHVEMWQELRKRSPALAMFLQAKPDKERTEVFNAMVEEYDAKYKAAHPQRKSKKTEK